MTFPILFAIALVFLFTQTDPRRAEFTRRTLGALVLTVALILAFGAAVHAQSGRTFYIDFTPGVGSNSNAGTKASPWKSHPFMQTGSGCTGGVTGWGGYSHQAGDHFILKGGVTWPAPCFGMNVANSGTSQSTVSGYNQAPTINGADYYGVDVTWFAGGSFTRPVFDMAGSFALGSTFAVINSSASYVTFDDIEIAHNITEGTCGGGTMDFAGSTGITVNRMYIHDWTIYMGQANADHYSASICGGQGTGNTSLNIYNTEMSDAAQPAGSQMGTCFAYVSSIAWSNCHNVAEGIMFSGASGVMHDDQVHDLDGNKAYSTNGVHTNGIEPAYAGQPTAFYDNYMYNLDVGFNVLCPGTAIYNNIASNIYNSAAGSGIALDGAIALDTDCAGVSNSTQTLVSNNTFDPNGSFSGGSSFRIVARSGSPPCPPAGCNSGLVTLKNNISINSSFDLSGATQTPAQATNTLMSAADASKYGFTQATKYLPSSTDPNTSGTGTNLSASCNASLPGLCFDLSGAPFIGGTYQNRPASPAGWDLGAFQGTGGGGGSGPPTVSVSSPAAGSQNGTVTFTLAATPQGSATISSCQLTIDGYNFGAALTSAPYQRSWDTTTASNQAHSLSGSCTDSNNQTGTAAPITVTPNNSLPNAFVSNANFSTFQTFTPQSTGTQTYTFVVTPNSAGNAGDTAQDTPIGLSQVQATSYGQMAAILRANTNNVWDAYDGSVPGYHALNSAPYTPGTAYTFSMTPNLSASPQTYSLSETSPSNIVIATNFQLRLAVTSLGYINANSANDSTPDTVKVSNFAIGSSPVLSYNPGNLNFGNVTDSTSVMLTDSVTIASGPATISSVVVSGTGFSLDGSGTCPTSGSLSSACTYIVDFDPPSTGNYTGTLTVTSNATGSPQVFNLTGSGVASSPATVTLSTNASNPVTSIQMGSTQIHFPGATATITGTVVNGPATISVTLSGGNAKDFKIASDGCTGSIAASCQEVVQYTPHQFGTESTTAAFAISGQATQNVTLQGTSTVSTQVVATEN